MLGKTTEAAEGEGWLAAAAWQSNSNVDSYVWWKWKLNPNNNNKH